MWSLWLTLGYPRNPSLTAYPQASSSSYRRWGVKVIPYPLSGQYLTEHMQGELTLLFCGSALSRAFVPIAITFMLEDSLELISYGPFCTRFHSAVVAGKTLTPIARFDRTWQPQIY